MWFLYCLLCSVMKSTQGMDRCYYINILILNMYIYVEYLMNGRGGTYNIQSFIIECHFILYKYSIKHKYTYGSTFSFMCCMT